MSVNAVAERVPVSLRLPRDVLDSVDALAHRKGVSRTSAFIDLLHKGVEAQEGAVVDERLERIESMLADLTESLGGQFLGARGTPFEEDPSTEQVAHAIAQACEACPAIKRAYLFGSFARGTAGPASDVDVRVEIVDGQRFNLRDLDHFAKRIEQATGRDVDVISARQIRDESLRESIEREKVLVYEREA